jgi:uridine phosphorylase
VRAVPSQRGVRAIHLRPTAELAERVLLPGDPRRALVVAQSLLDSPRMFNHNRGLWGYTGSAPDGEPLTVQATGMGGPSAAIVCEELIALGARRLVRIGTCGALGEDLRLGDLLAAQEVLPADGASAALGADSLLRPDPALTAALVAAGAKPATVVSTDLFYHPRDGVAGEWTERGASAVEMEAAAVLSVAGRHGVAAACALAVSDVPAGDGSHRRIADDDLEALGPRLGELGYRALRTPRP